MYRPSLKRAQHGQGAVEETLRSRGTCAWCGLGFPTIIDLLDHVDHGHLPPQGHPAAPSPRDVAVGALDTGPYPHVKSSATGERSVLLEAVRAP